jgi:hypothetical protein
MRKVRLLTAAAVGLAVSGSVSKADFVITHSRTSNAFTLNSQSYDVVTFSVVNDGINGTGSTLISVDAALYTPNPGGMLIGVGNGAKGSVPANAADVFGTNPANFNTASWIGDGTSPFTLSGAVGGSVLLLGGDPTSNAGVAPNSQTFTANQPVQGIAGTIFTLPPPQPAGGGVIFAQAVVQHNAFVTLLNPVATGARAFEHNSGLFSSDGNSTLMASVTFEGSAIVDVPEPASFALVGIGAAGLLPRRRRVSAV